MAGGKETPRQKMIGLMYLVLTAMLALNVSKAILKGYLSVNDSLEKSKKNITENNARVTEAFKNSILLNKAAEPYFNQMLIAQKDITEAYVFIDKVKAHMMKAVVGMDKSVQVAGDTINLRHAPWVDLIDNYDIPTQVLIGSDEHNPSKDEFSAYALKNSLIAVHDKLIKQLEKMQVTQGEKFPAEDYDNLKRKVDYLMPVASGFVEDGIKFTWEMDQVDHLPMAAVFVNLNKMQADLKNVEAEMLQVFSAASGKLTLKFDQLKARVIANSSYVQAGQPYEADIFIGASSSKISNGDMEIILGVDSVQAAAGSKGSGTVPIVNGEGKYKLNTSAEGDQKYKGVIKYKNPDGSVKYYPFEQEYKVAKAAGTVSADQMRVFYAGVPNPVTAAAAGISPNDVQLSATGAGAKFVSKGSGQYEATFTGPGECIVTVSAKTKDGIKPQGVPIKFRVKPLPKPEAKIGGKFAPPEMKKSELSLVSAIGAGANGFDFQANYVVQSYEITGKVRGNVKLVSGNGSSLSPDAESIFKGADVGGKIYVDLKVKGPDGKIYSSVCGIKVTR